MKEKKLLKAIRSQNTIPNLIYCATGLSIMAYLIGLKFTHPSYYFVLYALCCFSLARYKYTGVDSYFWYRDRVCKPLSLLIGVIFCLVAYFIHTHSAPNYLHSPDSTHILILEEGNRKRDGYLDIYKKQLFFKLYVDRFEVYKGHPLILSELYPRGGNVFKGSNTYQIGLTYFDWLDNDTLEMTHSWGDSMTISFK